MGEHFYASLPSAAFARDMTADAKPAETVAPQPPSGHFLRKGPRKSGLRSGGAGTGPVAEAEAYWLVGMGSSHFPAPLRFGSMRAP